MVAVTFFQDGGLSVGYDMRGHAGAGRAGRDVVCAAISSAAYYAANTLTEVLRLPAEVTVGGGSMRVILAKSAAGQAQPMLLGLKLHLDSLAEAYPDFLNVKVRGVKKCSR